ncbi:MAG: TIGR03792 family protein [Thermosynechococcaceae cyanobacterium]
MLKYFRSYFKIVLAALVSLGVAIALHSVSTAPSALPAPRAHAAVEWLRLTVDPSHREQYLKQDAKIWTPALASYPGFIDKVTWLNPNNASEVIFVIRWTSREQWFSIPQADLVALEKRFDATFLVLN